MSNAQTFNQTLSEVMNYHGGLKNRLHFGMNSAADNSALIMGSGTSAAPATTATANKKFVELRCESSATDAGSDTRNTYLALSLTGATTGGGDCLRAITNVNENVGTARGAHISLSFKAAAGGSECSGLGAAIAGTLHIPDIASWAPAGTLASGVFEIYSDGANSDPAGLTELSVLRLCNSGDATGAADVDTDACILSLQGWTAATGVTNAISSTGLTELNNGTGIGIRIKVGSSVYYIPAIPAADWN